MHLALRLAGSAGLPKDYALDQNYPNPFNPMTFIRFQLPVSSLVTLRVYNVLGQEVAKLVDEFQAAGYKTAGFDASTLSSGVYFYRLDAVSVSDPAKGFTQVKKMLLMK